MVDPNTIAVGDFVEAGADAPVRRGTYRVVGAPAEALVCLRVTDEGGRREHTGDVVRVDAAEASALERTSEPRSGLVGVLKNVVQGPYWLVWSLLPFHALG